MNMWEWVKVFTIIGSLVSIPVAVAILVFTAFQDSEPAYAYTPCPYEDMVRVPVNYPEGPDECVHIDTIENEFTFFCEWGERYEGIIMAPDGRQYRLAMALCEMGRN